MSACRAGAHDEEVNWDAELAAFLRFAQARHQRARGITPHQEQWAAITIDAAVGEGGLLTEIEQALMDAPLCRLSRHLSQGTHVWPKPQGETVIADHDDS